MPLCPVVNQCNESPEIGAANSESRRKSEKKSGQWQQPPNISSPGDFVACGDETRVYAEEEIEEVTEADDATHSTGMAWANVVKCLVMLGIVSIPLGLAIFACVMSGGLAIPFLVMCGISFLVALGDVCCACYNLYQIKQGKEPLVDGEDCLCSIARKCAQCCGVSERTSLLIGQITSLLLRAGIDLSCMYTGSVVKGSLNTVKHISFICSFLQTGIYALMRAMSYAVSHNEDTGIEPHPERPDSPMPPATETIFNFCLLLETELEKAGSDEEREQISAVLKTLLCELNQLRERNNGTPSDEEKLCSSHFVTN